MQYSIVLQNITCEDGGETNVRMGSDFPGHSNYCGGLWLCRNCWHRSVDCAIVICRFPYLVRDFPDLWSEITPGVNKINRTP